MKEKRGTFTKPEGKRTFEDYKRFYEDDDRFKRYVDRFSNEFGISVDEAISHKIVQGIADSYSEALKDKITIDGIVVGCGGADAPMGEAK